MQNLLIVIAVYCRNFSLALSLTLGLTLGLTLSLDLSTPIIRVRWDLTAYAIPIGPVGKFDLSHVIPEDCVVLDPFVYLCYGMFNHLAAITCIPRMCLQEHAGLSYYSLLPNFKR